MGFLYIFRLFLFPCSVLQILKKNPHLSEMLREEMCQHTVHGGPIALRKTSVSLQKTGRTEDWVVTGRDSTVHRLKWNI